MWLQSLHLTDLRCFGDAHVELARGTNLFVGPNGAGKTTLIEAAFLLSYARSFRRGGRSSLVRHGADRFVIHAEVGFDDGRSSRIGLQQARSGETEGRLDGRVLARVSELVTHLAVCCFEPGTHELIGGPSEVRRAFLDWSLFHVEHGFLAAWRRMQRALRQRNALLKAGAPERELLVWDRELAEHGARVTASRAGALAALAPALSGYLSAWAPELGLATLAYARGWDGDDGVASLEKALAERRERDRQRAHTSAGPHRADWSIAFEHAPRREHLSRGQEKLVALACVLAQADHYRQAKGEWPVMCFDDLVSELDAAHAAKVLAGLEAVGAQVLITGTSRDSLPTARVPCVFHVEHGAVRPELA